MIRTHFRQFLSHGPSFFPRAATWIAAFALIGTAHAYNSEPATNPFISEGYAAHEAGKTDEALGAFQKALTANDKDVAALMGTAMIYAEQERHSEAFSSFDTVVRYAPDNVFAWNGRGLAAFNMENFDEALASFERATANQPVNGFFYESLAWTWMCRGDFVKAAEAAKQAILMYSRRGEASSYPLLIAYFSYLESGDFENAGRTLDYAVANRPGGRWPTPVIDYLDGRILATDLISYVSNSAEETEAQTYIGLQLRSEGKHADAARHLEWVSQKGDPRVFEYTLARSLSLQGKVASVHP